MPRIRCIYSDKMDEDLSDLTGEITVVDVYDIASDIGKECEKIIDYYGADAVTALMPKVINALELLESLATRNERENTQLRDLQTKIDQLESDKLEKAEYRQKFERELEAIEEQWRAESKELVALVARLQEENRRLGRDLSPRHQAQLAPADGALLAGLQASVGRQRDELRRQERQLAERAAEADGLRAQAERLGATARELRRKHKSAQAQVRQLCDERADFLVQLQDQQRDIGGLRQRLGLAQKENEDLAKSDAVLPSGKAIWDLDDPNRPRFTTQELKDILHERNELKARVSDLEDELDTYRPKIKKAETFKNLLPIVDKIEKACFSIIYSPLDEDAPVQGPLPYEPDDAPWKRCADSGIRKFFRKLFSESGSPGSGSSFPRRSLSTLSKMALSATNEPVPV